MVSRITPLLCPSLGRVDAVDVEILIRYDGDTGWSGRHGVNIFVCCVKSGVSNDSQHRAYLEAQQKRASAAALERADSSSSSVGSSSSGKPPLQQQPQQGEKGSIGSFVQMAKTGYQELVNAIIR